MIHTFLYERGLNDISGLATDDRLCDSRLSAIMIGYGGANLESFVVRSYILYSYARYHRGVDVVRASSLAVALFAPVTGLVSLADADLDVGDADVPGRYAMMVRSAVAFVTFLLSWCA